MIRVADIPGAGFAFTETMESSVPSRIQSAMSLAAATPRASWPRREFARFSSIRMALSTGSAVTPVQMAMPAAKTQGSTAESSETARPATSPMPARKPSKVGTTILASAMTAKPRLPRRNVAVSICSPVRKAKNSTAIDPTPLSGARAEGLNSSR